MNSEEGTISDLKSVVKPARYLTSCQKRSIDVVVSIVGIFATSLILPLVAILIKFDSRGPVFYFQNRLGIDGSPIRIVKFRTMVFDAEAGDMPVWASANDPRVTRAGRLLRGLYLDEFPQWWNVFRGDMSVVGPRPERPELTRLITEKYPRFVNRLSAKPGITGLAQTEYRYTNSVTESRNKLKYDQRYISHASLSLDLWIMFRTFIHMIRRKGT